MPGRKNHPWIDDRGHWRTWVNGRRHRLGRASEHSRKRKSRGLAHTIRSGQPEDHIALARFHELMSQANRSEVVKAPGTVNGLIDAWLERHPSSDHEYRLATFAEFAGRRRPHALPTDLLTDYRDWLADYAPKTVIDRVRVAARCLRWGAKQEWCVAPVVPSMPRPERHARDVDPSILADVLNKLPERAGRICRFIAATGCRPSEAVRLRWDDVDLRTRTCVLGRHKTAAKTGEPRTIYLTPPAHELLMAMPGEHVGVVFRSRLGKPYTVAGLRAILRRHGGITPYQLRHTFGQIVSEQVSEQDLAKLMGHQDTRTTRRYFDVRDARAIAVASRLTLPQVAPPPPKPAPPKRRAAKPVARPRRRAKSRRRSATGQRS